MNENWKNQARTDIWRIEQVDPINPDVVRGDLLGVTSISLTWGYYTDTRGSASVTTLGDDGYLKHSQLRIIHEIPEWNYVHELFTGYVTDVSKSVSHGTKQTTYTLKSPLYALDADIQAWTFVVGSNGMAINAMRSLFERCNRPYLIHPESKDYRFSSTKVYPIGDSHLKTLFDLSNLAGDRVSVDGHGLVTISPYTPPSQLTPQWYIDTDDEETMVLNDSISETSTEFEVPGRVIVTHKDGDNEITAWADSDVSKESSSLKRGYMLSQVQDVTDLSGGQQQAQALANQYLEDAQASYNEWQVSALYMPIREGDCVEFSLYGESHHTMVKTLDVSPLNGTMKVTLKEV